MIYQRDRTGREECILSDAGEINFSFDGLGNIKVVFCPSGSSQS
jgi:hypothetical protein